MNLSTAHPELPYLDVFYTVCVEGGFTAAASRLGCTQPAISYQIRALERALGARLIERGGRRVLLTPSGERVKAFCQQFFGELGRVRAACGGSRPEDPLRLASASGFGRYVLMPVLARMSSGPPGSFPELRVQFDAEDVVIGRLERGECEAAFVYTRRVSNTLRYRAVYDEELVLIAARAMRRRLPPRALKRLDTFEAMSFVTYQEGDYVFGRWFDTNFGDQPAVVRSAAHFSELEEVVAFVRRGAGLSIVPRDCLKGMRGGGIVVLKAGRGVPCINQVFVVTRAGSVFRRELEGVVKRLRPQVRSMT